MPDWPASQAMIDALGWALVHFLWQGFAFALLFAVVTSPGVVTTAARRHALGVGVLFAAAAAPLATFWLRLADGPSVSAAPALVGARPGVAFWLGAGVEAVLPWVVGLWAVGVALLSSRLVVGWFGCRRLAGRRTRPVEARLDAVIVSLVERLRLSRPVRVLASARVSVPTVIGWLRPVVLLPAGAVARMGVEQLEMVLAHEFAHVRRCDWLLNLAQRIVETLLFYHPAVRWMSRRIREERELACDDIAVQITGRPVAYARALAQLETFRHDDRGLALAATGGDLRHRVERIVGQDSQRADGAFVHFTVLATLTAALTFGAADMSPRGDGLRETARACPASRMRERAIGARAHAALGAGNRAAKPEAGGGTPPERFARFDADDAVSPVAVDAPEVVAAATEVNANPKATTKAVVAAAAGPAESPQAELPSAALTMERLAAAPPVPRRAPSEPVRMTAEPIALETPARPDRETMLASVGGASPAVALRNMDPNTRYALLSGGEEADDDEMTIVPRLMVAPDYPFRARRDGTEGFVKLAFSVDPRGRVSEVEVVDAFPKRVFDQVASRALREWRFDVDERLTENLRMVQTFDFILEDVDRVSVAERRRCRGSVARAVCAPRARNMDVVYVNPPRRMRQR